MNLNRQGTAVRRAGFFGRTCAWTALLGMLACTWAAAGSALKSDEHAVLFTTIGYRDGDAWRLPLHGWVFEPEHDSVWRGSMLASVRNALDITPDSPEAERFAALARWFIVDNERGKSPPLQVEHHDGAQPGFTTSADGHFRGEARLNGAVAPGWITITAHNAAGAPAIAGHALLVDNAGISVISDIDDTIKVSEVLDKRRLLRRTFLEPYEAVAGMSDLYRSLTAQGAVFHYLSGSPWQLYVPLSEFLDSAGFPRGALYLREFRAKSDSRWNLLEKAYSFKLLEGERILRRFPGHSFVLIGDAGEQDPEVYGELARRYPQQIRVIAIRRLENDGFGAARQHRALRHVGATFIEFTNPPNIASLLDGIM
jgi:Uncharacterized conserved protein (DUF2183)